jgi:hypothetical protein
MVSRAGKRLLLPNRLAGSADNFAIRCSVIVVRAGRLLNKPDGKLVSSSKDVRVMADSTVSPPLKILLGKLLNESVCPIQMFCKLGQMEESASAAEGKAACKTPAQDKLVDWREHLHEDPEPRDTDGSHKTSCAMFVGRKLVQNSP